MRLSTMSLCVVFLLSACNAQQDLQPATNNAPQASASSGKAKALGPDQALLLTSEQIREVSHYSMLSAMSCDVNVVAHSDGLETPDRDVNSAKFVAIHNSLAPFLGVQSAFKELRAAETQCMQEGSTRSKHALEAASARLKTEIELVSPPAPVQEKPSIEELETQVKEAEAEFRKNPDFAAQAALDASKQSLRKAKEKR